MEWEVPRITLEGEWGRWWKENKQRMCVDQKFAQERDEITTDWIKEECGLKLKSWYENERNGHEYDEEDWKSLFKKFTA